MLVPTGDSGNRDRAGVVRQLDQFGRGRALKGIAMRELIEHGRRF
jgi:hypothetical protein